MASNTAGSNFNSVVYPKGQVEGLRTLSVVLALTATTAISYCFAQRAYTLDFFSRRGLSSINLTKWLLLLLFIDSWAFVFLSGILINGIGMSLNPTTCMMGIFTCIIFYCMSKLLTYLFLLEKVYIVWPSKGGRFSSIPYRVGFCAVLGFVVVLVAMVIGRIAYLTDDNQCIIGLQPVSSMTSVFVDLFVNILLTSLFLWPLWRSKLLSPNIRRVASRTLVASFSALAISAANLTILAVLHGQELGWICLASCSTDVVVNAMVLFWLTRPGRTNDEPSSSGGPNSNQHKSENGKSVGGGVVQMHRISVNPGVHANGHTGPFTSRSSLNGLSKVSTALRIPDNTNTPPRSPMKVNFSEHPTVDVYDGSQPYVREALAPSIDNKPASLSDKRTSISFPQSPTEIPAYLKNQKRHSVGLPQPPRELPSFFTDQKRHSVGFIYEKTVTTGGSASGGISPTSLFNKIIGKRSPLDGVQRSPTPNGKGRRGSDEDVGVHITVTTMFDHDDPFINVAGANRSSEDQSKAASERSKRPVSPFRG